MYFVMNAFFFSSVLLCFVKESCSEFCNEFPTDNLNEEEAEVCLAGCCGPEGEQYCCMRDDTYHLLVIGLPFIAVFMVLASLAYLRWYCEKKMLKNKGDDSELYSHISNIPAHTPFLQSISDVNVNANYLLSTEPTQRIPYMGYAAPPPSYSSIYPHQAPETATLLDTPVNSNLSSSRAVHDQDSTLASSHSNIPTQETPPPSYSLDDPCKKNIEVIGWNRQHEAPPPNYSTVCLHGSNILP